MKKRIRILIVEDCEDDAELLIRELKRGGYEPGACRVDTQEAMEKALDEQPWDIILSDHMMPHFNSEFALNVLKKKALDIPFIIVSGSIGEDVAVAAMKSGAHDYLTKGNLARLVPAIERELKELEARRERKKFEDRLVQAQKMEAIGQLAGGIAHDFNNLLSVILGYSDFLSTSVRNGDSVNSFSADIDEIKGAAHRAASLTRQLLAFSRRQVLQPVIMNLNTSVTGMEKMLRRLIGEDIQLTISLNPTLGQIKADPGQMEQVLMNLVINARDAMPHGGQLFIETNNVTIDPTSFPAEPFDVNPGPYVTLSVKDTGCGIPPEIKTRIFEPFFTTKEKGKGTGLGLATVFGVVKQSGGYIWADSQPNCGATFIIHLPQVYDNPDPVLPDKILEFSNGSETILITEDEDQIRMMLRKFLEIRGYNVLEAPNAETAFNICQARKTQIHLVVTDIVLPGSSGLDLAARLKTVCPHMKTLFMSGYTDHAAFRQEVPELKTNFLLKPFTSDHFANKIREILDRK